MTREEAKEILTHNWTRVDNPNYSESELDEAFFMAIEALTHEIRTETHGVCSDLISRSDAMSQCKNAENELTNEAERKGLRVARFIIGELPSAEALLKQEIDFHKEVSRIEAEKVVDLEHKLADAVQGYAEWLEKIIVDNEGSNEWLCEATPDLEWCENNCHYSSIQAECLRHLYEVSKGGDSE